MTTLLCAALLLASDAIPLPKPQTTGGKPLMQALKLRASAREFRADALAPQMMSNLLWAAFGVNRPDGKRTAPSTHGKNEIDIYVVTASGAYRYRPETHRLDLVTTQDLRKPAGTQDFVETAPINLIYVADMTAFDAPTPEEKLHWVGTDAGVIAQNVGLFCASEGLGNVVRAGWDRDVLTKALKLEGRHRIVLAQTVGYPK